MVDPQPVISFLTHFSYIGAFSSIIVSGYILPIPEEIVLLTIGYLSGTGLFNIFAVILVSFIATLASDVFLYSLTKKDSKFTRRMKLKMQNTEFCKSFIKNPKTIGKAIFVMRFFVGLRFLSPILAGAMNIPLKKFVLYDTLALIIYTPFFIFLGYYFHNSFLRIVTRVETVRHMLFVVALTVIGIIFLQIAQKNLWRLRVGSKKIAESKEEIE